MRRGTCSLGPPDSGRVTVINDSAGDGVVIRSNGANTNKAGTANSLVLGCDYTTAISYIVAGGSATNTTLTFYTAASAAPVERMRLDSSGNLGIGTSSPASALDVRFATNPVTDNGNGLNAIRSITTAALAANNGGAVSMGGTATLAGTTAAFAQIAGRKANATSADYAGYLQFAVNNSGGTMSEVARLRPPPATSDWG
jgi:hypothetical protein